MGKPKWNDKLRQQFFVKLRKGETKIDEKPASIWGRYSDLVGHMACDTFKRNWKPILAQHLAREGMGGKLFLLMYEIDCTNLLSNIYYYLYLNPVIR